MIRVEKEETDLLFTKKEKKKSERNFLNFFTLSSRTILTSELLESI